MHTYTHTHIKNVLSHLAAAGVSCPVLECSGSRFRKRRELLTSDFREVACLTFQMKKVLTLFGFLSVETTLMGL